MGKNNNITLMNSNIKCLENIRDNVRVLRCDILGVSQTEMARLCNVSRDVLWRIENLNTENIRENKTVYPNIYTIVKICNALGVSISEMLDRNLKSDVELKRVMCERMGLGNGFGINKKNR